VSGLICLECIFGQELHSPPSSSKKPEVIHGPRESFSHQIHVHEMIVAVLGLLSCGGSDSIPPATNSGGGGSATGTPAGTSTVTVRATYGARSTSVPVTLVVTR
jgi:hypothetical protein